MRPPPLPPESQPDTTARPTDRRGVIGAANKRVLSQRARLGGEPAPGDRSPRALAISVALHLMVGLALVQLLTFGHGLSGFLGLKGPTEQREERLSYVTPAVPKPQAVAQPKAPPKPSTAPSLAPPTAGPVVTPTIEAPVTPPAARTDTGSGAGATGTGTGVGTIDPNLRGVQPGYTDSRVWRGSAGGGGASAGTASSRNGAERLDSIISFAITSVADSLEAVARAQGRYGRAPGDWTKTGKNGDKWGWDNAGIRLGKVVIPNALLTLLPLNAQVAMSGNSTAIDRERRLALSRTDIIRNADMALGDAEFRKLVNELRDRREKERRDRLRAPDASLITAKPIGKP